MDNTKINPQDTIFALDIGTRSVIGTVGIVKDKKFFVIEEHCVEHEERAMIDGQIHDITLVANTVNIIKSNLEKKLNIKLKNVAIAAAGRFLKTMLSKARMEIDDDKEIDKDTIRTLELTAVKTAEQKINEETSGKLYCVGYSVKNYYLNGYLISNLLSHKATNIEIEVIATFLPKSVVDSLYSVMAKVGLQVVSLTLEPIAAIEVAIPKKLRLLNLALIDVGAGTSDIAISSNDTISSYGMVPLAGDEVTEVIAQNYLVDFNTAENIKRASTTGGKYKYKDVLDIENEISSEEVIKVISPVVKKIADEVGNKIIELNGGKSPNAVFMVGGGAYTPKLKDFLAEKLNLQDQRIGIKSREDIKDCVCTDNSLGSIGVTVLGIALTSIRKFGNDFIDVFLNDSVISLFNSHKHTVIDVIIQAGINPKVFMGKNGKNLKFILNGINRVAFGSLSTPSEIKINDAKANIDDMVKEGDRIIINYAVNGNDARPNVKDYIQKVYSVSFFINDIMDNLEPVAIINGKRVDINTFIKENDIVEILFPETLRDYKKYFLKDDSDDTDYEYYLEGQKVSFDHVINEGEKIYRIKKEDGINSKDNSKDEKKSSDGVELNIVANGKNITLKGKEQYVFVDIFNYIEFNLAVPKGKLFLRLNGENAGYYDKLSEGDVIEIGWDKRSD
ncbi:cell division protein FtsA [Clostridium fermenticellae]|uniref:Cell division protein FtsA n=1 Tax=Clostridium fermenticellae TaxID=2068654 RepID=A0A386H3I7_9CLOT|nr:cell division FtsA domain-containing protein [Clostridium fermenticellae]AYD40262.1 cell division protein FtsA [Clostridium fermenticellae]